MIADIDINTNPFTLKIDHVYNYSWTFVIYWTIARIPGTIAHPFSIKEVYLTENLSFTLPRTPDTINGEVNTSFFLPLLDDMISTLNIWLKH